MNTTRLLVAEAGVGARVRELHVERLFSVLRDDRDPTDPLSAAEIVTLGRQVADVVALAREAGAERVAVVATAVLRSAKNRGDIVGQISAQVGEPLHVLDGRTEAHLVFAGAIGALDEPPEGELAVVDVGGGSTEVAVGTAAAGAHWAASVPLGSKVLTLAHFREDPPRPAEIEAARADADAAMGSMAVPEVSHALAVGGDATTLHRLVGPVLDPMRLAAALERVSRLPSATVAERVSIAVERARVLPAALLLLDAAVRSCRTPLRLAGGGLREGVIARLLAGAEIA